MGVEPRVKVGQILGHVLIQQLILLVFVGGGDGEYWGDIFIPRTIYNCVKLVCIDFTNDLPERATFWP